MMNIAGLHNHLLNLDGLELSELKGPGIITGRQTTAIITLEEFQRRLTELCLQGGLTGFPRRRRDRHILLKSVVLTLDKRAEYTEPEVNPKLRLWLQDVGAPFHLDHVDLRRYLIDEEFLGRSRDGSRYWVAVSSRHQLVFDPEIEEVDVRRLLSRERARLERKKEEFLRRNHAPAAG